MASAQTIKSLPKGLHHLETIHKNKFVARYPTRAPRPAHKFVAVKDRVKHWNIVPGDKVRLMIGKPHEKFIDEKKESGWKVYTVASVDKERNRVFLDGLTNKKSSPIRPIPDNIDSLSEEEKQGYLGQTNYINIRRPVDYSNVQLCVEDKGPNSVFATRLRTSEPTFNREIRRFSWNRYPAKLSGELSDTTKTDSSIPWPKPTKSKDADEVTPWDTIGVEAKSRSLHWAPASEIPHWLVPKSMRAPPPKDQSHADEYIFNKGSRSDALMQLAMPFYLGEELSPRFSRSKMQKGWLARRQLERKTRGAVAKAAVKQWDAQGRDQGLESVLEYDAVGLEGVTIRPRTMQEVRDDAHAEFDAEVAAAKAGTMRARAAGMVFNDVKQKWEAGPKGKELLRRRSRRARKVRRMEDKLANLSLEVKKNQVIPPDLQ